MRNELGTNPRSWRRDCFARVPALDRTLTARELQLASDLHVATGNTARAELLSWAAHDARAAVSA